MITLGNRHLKCPYCGTDVIVGRQECELVHKCRNTDGSRKTSNKQRYFPGYKLTKMNTDHWQNLAMEPYPTELNESQKRAMKNETRNVTCDLDV